MCPGSDVSHSALSDVYVFALKIMSVDSVLPFMLIRRMPLGDESIPPQCGCEVQIFNIPALSFVQ